MLQNHVRIITTAFSGAKGIKTYCNMLKVDFLIPIPERKLVNFDDVVKILGINIKETVIRNTTFRH
ncbi:MAG: hypothetical protein DBY24_04035 [Prevotellaceae bacterium]|nr:MAG: hypothetical protein DBY24_04035 [Prevotellaceae bacterium]